MNSANIVTLCEEIPGMIGRETYQLYNGICVESLRSIEFAKHQPYILGLLSDEYNSGIRYWDLNNNKCFIFIPTEAVGAVHGFNYHTSNITLPLTLERLTLDYF